MNFRKSSLLHFKNNELLYFITAIGSEIEKNVPYPFIFIVASIILFFSLVVFYFILFFLSHMQQAITWYWRLFFWEELVNFSRYLAPNCFLGCDSSITSELTPEHYVAQRHLEWIIPIISSFQFRFPMELVTSTWKTILHSLILNISFTFPSEPIIKTESLFWFLNFCSFKHHHRI